MAGGVSANSGIRNKFTDLCEKNGINLTIPNIKYCTDNAAMIGSAAHFNYVSGRYHDIKDKLDLNAIANIKIGE